MMEWENNPSRFSICSHESSTGRGVIEFKVHWYVGVGNILLLFEYHHTMLVCMVSLSTISHLSVPEGKTQRGSSPFDAMKKTQLGPLRT